MPRPRNSSRTAACSAGSIRSSRAISHVTASTDERSRWASNCEASDCSRLTSTIAALRIGVISAARGGFAGRRQAGRQSRSGRPLEIVPARPVTVEDAIMRHPLPDSSSARAR